MSRRAPAIRAEDELRRAVARLNTRFWGIAGALALGVGLFAATNIVVMAGPGPAGGGTLAELHEVLPGYSVTFPGSLVGFVYGFVVGYGLARGIGAFYNRLVRDFPA